MILIHNSRRNVCTYLYYQVVDILLRKTSNFRGGVSNESTIFAKLLLTELTGLNRSFAPIGITRYFSYSLSHNEDITLLSRRKYLFKYEPLIKERFLYLSRLNFSLSSFKVSNNVSIINVPSLCKFDKIAESSVYVVICSLLSNSLRPRYLVTYLNSGSVARLNIIGDIPSPFLTPVVAEILKS